MMIVMFFSLETKGVIVWGESGSGIFQKFGVILVFIIIVKLA